MGGKRRSGEPFADVSHPYSRDLDLFGKGSLHELLCDARTRAGEEMLAKWLLAPASPEEVRARNAAVDELRSRLDLREDLATLGENVRSGVRPDALVVWAEGEPLLDRERARYRDRAFAFVAGEPSCLGCVGLAIPCRAEHDRQSRLWLDVPKAGAENCCAGRERG